MAAPVCVTEDREIRPELSKNWTGQLATEIYARRRSAGVHEGCACVGAIGGAGAGCGATQKEMEPGTSNRNAVRSAWTNWNCHGSSFKGIYALHGEPAKRSRKMRLRLR